MGSNDKVSMRSVLPPERTDCLFPSPMSQPVTFSGLYSNHIYKLVPYVSNIIGEAKRRALENHNPCLCAADNFVLRVNSNRSFDARTESI